MKLDLELYAMFSTS